MGINYDIQLELDCNINLDQEEFLDYVFVHLIIYIMYTVHFIIQ